VVWLEVLAAAVLFLLGHAFAVLQVPRDARRSRRVDHTSR
jgi:hypothetical protein